ncbi:MAG: isoprenylcysteine carboxylmethyltransferase family protein [Actinobacteria bacterium]|nr:isoprenylcysteine carboxylmethyltransferase family protein [Actinomycetota bacterium]
MTRPVLWGRTYFAAQALAGAAWWVLVFASPWVRHVTLGQLDPVFVALFDVPLFVLASGLAAAGIRIAAFIATGWTVLVAVALAGYATVTGQAGWGVLAMAAAAGGSVAALALIVFGLIPTQWILLGPFAFRLARPDGSALRHAVAAAVQIVLFWGFFLGVAPIIIRWLEHRWGLAITLPVGVPLVGAVIFVFASALGIWSAAAMSTLGKGTPLPAAMPRLLVVAGPYRFVRNPMAVSGIVQGVAVGLMLSSWLVVAYALLGSLLWNYAVRPHEEADLEARFGDPYRRYRNTVRCWVPGLPVARSVG